MGRGDIKTKKGKINNGSYGNSRLRKKGVSYPAKPAAEEGTSEVKEAVKKVAKKTAKKTEVAPKEKVAKKTAKKTEE